MADHPTSVVLDFFPCDRIIKEDNGKLAIIGVYSGGVALPPVATFPVNLPLWYWLRIKRNKKGGSAFRFEILNPEGSTIFSVAGNMNIEDETKPSVIVIPAHSNTSVTGYGRYEAHLTVDAEKLNVGSFNVEPQKVKQPVQEVVSPKPA
jgi:hypothetical protein